MLTLIKKLRRNKLTCFMNIALFCLGVRLINRNWENTTIFFTYISPFVRIGHLMLGRQIKEKFTDYVEVTSDERPERRDVNHSDDVSNPDVEGIRVQFYYAGMAKEVVTVIAMQKDGVLVPYTTTKGHQIALLGQGDLSIKQMFDAEFFDVCLEALKGIGAGILILYAAIVYSDRLIRRLRLRLPTLWDIVRILTFLCRHFYVNLVLNRPLLGAGLVAVAIFYSNKK